MRNRNARRSLSSRVAERVSNRQNGSRGFSYLMLPEGVEVFKPKKEGNVRFNIIPYIAGKHNRDAEAGELDYEFTFWIHTVGDGDDRKSIVCPKKTYGRPCPICEEVERLSKNYVENQDEIKAIKAKQRQLFNIIDARDEENKIQIYETSYYKGFGELLDKRLRNFDDEDDEDFRDFADIPGGRTLKVNFTEETFDKRKFFAPSSIDFVTRKEELPESVIDDAVCLDSCLKVLEYDQIVKLIAGTVDEDEEEEDEGKDKERKAKPNAKREKPSKKPVEQDEDEDDEDEEEDEPKEKVKSKKSKKPTKPVEEEDEEDEDEGEIDRYGNRAGRAKGKPEPDENDDEEDEEEEPPRKEKKSKKKPEPEDEDDEGDDEDEDEEDAKPAKKSKKKPAKQDEDEDDDQDDEDDEDEEDEDEKPAKKSKKDEKKAGKKSKCPHGFVWGADCYMNPECDKCDLVEECDAAQDEV